MQPYKKKSNITAVVFELFTITGLGGYLWVQESHYLVNTLTWVQINKHLLSTYFISDSGGKKMIGVDHAYEELIYF